MFSVLNVKNRNLKIAKYVFSYQDTIFKYNDKKFAHLYTITLFLCLEFLTFIQTFTKQILEDRKLLQLEVIKFC